MEKKIGIVLSLLLIYFIYSQKEGIQSFFLERYNGVKSSYFDAVFYLTDLYERHFEQSKTIQIQNEIIKNLKKENLQLLSYKERLFDLTQKPRIKDVVFSNAISYVNLANNNRLWIEMFEGFEEDKTYGAVDGRYSAGIIVSKDNKPMILLNSDPQSIYGVYVGNSQAPGVIYGIDHQRMIVKYIPQWMKISVGEIVKTSGLDNVFIPGIEVGVVVEVQARHGYKVAYVEPFANSLKARHFYIIKDFNQENIDLNLTKP